MLTLYKTTFGGDDWALYYDTVSATGTVEPLSQRPQSSRSQDTQKYLGVEPNSNTERTPLMLSSSDTWAAKNDEHYYKHSHAAKPLKPSWTPRTPPASL